MEIEFEYITYVEKISDCSWG